MNADTLTIQGVDFYFSERAWTQAIAIGILHLEGEEAALFCSNNPPLIKHFAASYLNQLGEQMHINRATATNSKLWAINAIKALGSPNGRMERLEILRKAESIDDGSFKLRNEPLIGLMHLCHFYSGQSVDNVCTVASGHSLTGDFEKKYFEQIEASFKTRAKEFVQVIAIFEIANRIAEIKLGGKLQAFHAVKTIERLHSSKLPAVQIASTWATHSIQRMKAKLHNSQTIVELISRM